MVALTLCPLFWATEDSNKWPLDFESEIRFKDLSLADRIVCLIQFWMFAIGRLGGFTSPTSILARSTVIWLNLLSDVFLAQAIRNFINHAWNSDTFAVLFVLFLGLGYVTRTYFEKAANTNSFETDAAIKLEEILDGMCERIRKRELDSEAKTNIIKNELHLVVPNSDGLKLQAKRTSLDHARCGICGDPIGESDDISFCADCEAPHHRECWQYFGRCSQYGCGQWENYVLMADAPDQEPERAE